MYLNPFTSEDLELCLLCNPIEIKWGFINSLPVSGVNKMAGTKVLSKLLLTGGYKNSSSKYHKKKPHSFNKWFKIMIITYCII